MLDLQGQTLGESVILKRKLAEGKRHGRKPGASRERGLVGVAAKAFRRAITRLGTGRGILMAEGVARVQHLTGGQEKDDERPKDPNVA